MTAILLATAVAVVFLASCLLLVPGDFLTRLHLLGAAGILGGGLTVLALLLGEGFSSNGVKSLLTFAILLLYGPILSHALARAERWRGEADL
jgi:multisubunit Na+/H+ antiporter MnhG subunit